MSFLLSPIAAHRDWIHQLSLYDPEYHNRSKPSELLLQYLKLVLPEFTPYLVTLENQLIQFSHHTKYKHPEPVIPTNCNAAELDAILLAAAQSLDQRTGILSDLPSTALYNHHTADLHEDEAETTQAAQLFANIQRNPHWTQLSPNSLLY